MSRFSKKLALVIRQRREQLGYSQEGFAAAARVDRSWYGKVERGEIEGVTLHSLMKIGYVLRRTPSELVARVTVEDCILDAKDLDRVHERARSKTKRRRA